MVRKNSFTVIACVITIMSYGQNIHDVVLLNNQPATLEVDAGPDLTEVAGNIILLGKTPLADGGTPPYNYNWQPLNSTLENPEVNVEEEGTFIVTVTDKVQCSVSDSVKINLTVTDIDETNKINGVNFFPNPAKDYVYIVTQMPIEALLIKDIKGSLILKKTLSPNKIDVSNLSQGLYYLEIHLKQKVVKLKLIKE